jgi:hypothetical protein
MSLARPSARPRLLPGSHLLLGSLLVSVMGACGPLEGVRPPVRDYVPPVLLSAPDPGPDLGPEGARAFREAAHRLRAELQSFVDTLSSGPGSYPAARCCAGELSHLLLQAQRWEGGSRLEAGVVPVLIRLAMEPGMDVAPLLADSVVARAMAQPMSVPWR